MIIGKVIGNDRQYRIDALIAKGAFSTVYRCESVLTSCPYAIKVISKEVVQRHQMRQALIREVHAMEVAAGSPYVVKLVDKLVSQHNYYIVTELAEGGTLLDLIRVQCRSGAYEWGKSLCRQLLIGVASLHECNIVHRDIKPENILLNKEKMKIMISDFGFSCYAAPDALLHRECGTLKYCAPELLHENPSYDGRKVDVWATGITIYLVIFGVHPFPCKNRDPDVLLELITRKALTFPKYASPELRDMLSKMLEVDPNKRWGAADLLHHPWMEDTSAQHSLDVEVKSPSNHSLFHETRGESVARSPLAIMTTDVLEALNSFSGHDSVDDGFYFLNRLEKIEESFLEDEIVVERGCSSTTPLPSGASISLSTLGGSTSFQTTKEARNRLFSLPSLVVERPIDDDLDSLNSHTQCQRLAVEIREIVCFVVFCEVLLFVFAIHFLFGFLVQNFYLLRKLSDGLEWLLACMFEIVVPCENKKVTGDFHRRLSDLQCVEMPGKVHSPRVLQSRVSYHVAKAANFITNTLQGFLPMHQFRICRNLISFAHEEPHTMSPCDIHRNRSEGVATSSFSLCEEGSRMFSPLVAPAGEDEKGFLSLSHSLFPLNIMGTNAVRNNDVDK
ncbi:unnamed protein product [Phytomonas sp. EM1]|nr:unnamed protein product [Phytomonas sp. EM1]|eukprot:CCW62296.1 unnamed protein product [Phytomonas sp. isolate EM1]